MSTCTCRRPQSSCTNFKLRKWPVIELGPLKDAGQIGIVPVVNFLTFHRRGRAGSGLVWPVEVRTTTLTPEMGQKPTNIGETLWVSLSAMLHASSLSAALRRPCSDLEVFWAPLSLDPPRMWSGTQSGVVNDIEAESCTGREGWALGLNGERRRRRRKKIFGSFFATCLVLRGHFQFFFKK